MPATNAAGVVAVALVILAVAACAARGRDAPRAAHGATAWPEAEILFRRDPAWRGGDAAYSIDLGGERRLWLFGDSFVHRPGAVGRAGCAMPRNTIALQEGRDPCRARMTFAWRGTREQPASWFEEDGAVWHWPLDGVCLDDVVTVFCTRVERTATPGPFGFRAVGWTAFRIAGTGAPLAAWRAERIDTPRAPFPCVVGTAVVAHGDHVYAYALREPGDHALAILRWSRAAFVAGDLGAPEWHDAGTWRAHRDVAAFPAPILAEAAPEFSVHAVPGGGYVMVQTLGFGATELAVRTAPRPEGPWSAARAVFRPPDSDRDGVFVYAGKAHAGLWDGGLVMTWASNAWDFATVVRDETLYFPRCARLPWAVVRDG